MKPNIVMNKSDFSSMSTLERYSDASDIDEQLSIGKCNKPKAVKCHASKFHDKRNTWNCKGLMKELSDIDFRMSEFQS